MKYISLLIFTAALAWTWHLVHSDSNISFETHSGIQERLATFIVEAVKAKKPTASDILVEKIWTEVVDSDKVRAFFVYSFKDNSENGPVTSQIRGEGLLERQPDDGSGNDRWILKQFQASSDAISFDDATIVTGSATGESEAVPVEGESIPLAPDAPISSTPASPTTAPTAPVTTTTAKPVKAPTPTTTTAPAANQ